ncbi:MAG: RagB/SusD family nutrient uptake outer membrane protein [Bacteroidales bacterium]|nr:RagB/SusD family nutrient uptake outer membrane protein [Bacteroidales bacterium]
MKLKEYLMGLVAAAGLTAGVSSCTDLEPTIYSNLTTSNAYSTEADINAAVVGLYADLTPYPGDAWLYYGGYFVMISDYATDMGFSTAAGDPTKLSTMTYDANNRYFRLNWQNMYQIITNANVILEAVEGVNMTDANKTLVRAQAKFLRALAYRDLTDAFGPVPLLTQLVDPTQAKDMELTSVAEIEDLLIADLKECINDLPETWTGEDLARATKGAAATLLGKIYLRRHDYNNAKTYISQVLALRDKGVYALESDFRNVWSENNKYGKEMIFCVLHEATSNGGEITNHFGPQDHPDVPGRWQYYGVSLPFWRSYDKEDPRREFFYYDYTGGSNRDDKSDYGFRYMVPDEGVTEVPNDTTKFMNNVATMKYSYEMISDTYYDGRTICIFRLSDVILCMAEIENNLQGPSAALPYLNEIRQRAGAPIYGSARFPVPTTKEAMNEAILNERGYELVFEFQRRADLIRFGKYEETVNAHLKKLGISKPTTVTDKLRYFPYPLDETKLNSFMNAENPSRLPQ